MNCLHYVIVFIWNSFNQRQIERKYCRDAIWSGELRWVDREQVKGWRQKIKRKIINQWLSTARGVVECLLRSCFTVLHLSHSLSSSDLLHNIASYKVSHSVFIQLIFLFFLLIDVCIAANASQLRARLFTILLPRSTWEVLKIFLGNFIICFQWAEHFSRERKIILGNSRGQQKFMEIYFY